MYIKTLKLFNFKSWDSLQLEFSAKLNCFVGPNGIGKTNLLDALHYVSLTKSYFSQNDQQSIGFGGDAFSLEVSLERNGTEEKILCAFQRAKKKQFKKDGKEYEKLSDHIGRIPSVVISPYDRDLITESSEIRRRFIDSVLSQGNPQYLFHLMRYNRALQQRNHLLRHSPSVDATTLELYNAQMVEHAEPVHRMRKEFVEVLTPRLAFYYREISAGSEAASLSYASRLNDQPLNQLLMEAAAKDLERQHTTVGVHRDDLKFELDAKSVKHYGSQGQQKSFLIALKLAQFEFIRKQQQVTPILLLDDIFDKLDEQRVAQLVQLVHDQGFGQIFITDTHPERTAKLVKAIDEKASIFNLEQLKQSHE